MTDKCRNDCIDKLLFPKQPSNRPGLSRIDYRIGDYSDILEALHRKLNQNAALADWTHREADDPGIALLEGASILGDILTFYQQVYANEAYLRTAQWRESIADLVRLLGYRLSPGLGGKATFVFDVKGDKPVVIPAGFPVKAQLEEQGKSVDFQTREEAIAYPALGKFNLYPPCKLRDINSTINSFSIKTSLLKENNIKLNVQDRLMLVVDPTDSLTRRQVVMVEDVRECFDRTEIYIKGYWKGISGENLVGVYAYKIGRSFRHFGHNAPGMIIQVRDGETSTETVQFSRRVSRRRGEPIPAVPPGTYDPVKLESMPLDAEVDDITVGSIVLVKLQLSENRRGVCSEHFFVRRVRNVFKTSLTQGRVSPVLPKLAISGGTTVVELNARVFYEEKFYSDIRSIELFEVTGEYFFLEGVYEREPFFDLNTLFYFGTSDVYKRLNGRSLFFVKEDGTEAVAVATTDNSKINLQDKNKFHPLSLHDISQNFSTNDFSLRENFKVIVYGNLVDATQGKTEKEAVLGNGDNRETFQTFKIPKAPVTYFISKDETPPEVPELQVYVNGRLWRRVPSFYGHGPKEQIYIVREDDDNKSWVQFGDGKTGARLPSGIKNIVARYWTGTGAFGAIKEGASPQAGKQLDRLRKVYLPDVVSGGSGPEDGDNAREAAPGKVQSLGRLVSLQDFETEALGISGVEKVSANWRLENYIPTVVITALMESGRENEFDELQGVLAAYNIDRGPDRFPVSVHEAHRQYVYLTLDVGFDSSWYDQEQIKKSIKEVLGVTGEEDKGIDGSKGLFGIKQRRFGQREYSNRIEGVVQNVDGVIWAGVSLFGVLPAISDDPLELTRPEPGQYHSVIPIARSIMIQQFPGFSWKEKGLKKQTIKSLNVEFDDILFCLHAAHLKIIPATADTTEVTTDD